MKKLLCIILLLTAANTYANECQFTVRVAEYEPLYYQTSEGNWKGISVELTDVLMEQSGCRPIYRKYPWKRALVEIEKGRLDMILNLSFNEKRSQYIHYIGPMLDETIVLVAPKGSNDLINNLDDLKKIKGKIGILIGQFYGKDFLEKYNSDKEFAQKFRVLPRSENFINMYKKKHISAFFVDLEYFNLKVKQDTSYSVFSINPFTIYQNWIYFGFSKKTVEPKQLVRMQEAFVRAKEKGLFEEVIKRYRNH